MSVFYKLWKMVARNGNSQQAGWYARSQKMGVVDDEQIAARISHHCTLTVADVKAVLKALSVEMKDIVQSGNAVYLEGIGEFYISLESKLVDSKTAFNAKKHIHKVKINFIPEGHRDALSGKISRDWIEGIELKELPR